MTRKGGRTAVSLPFRPSFHSSQIARPFPAHSGYDPVCQPTVRALSSPVQQAPHHLPRFTMTASLLEVYVVAHTHWDREWYHPAERFRQRLVALIDELLRED